MEELTAQVTTAAVTDRTPVPAVTDYTPDGPFLTHAKDQVTWRLLKKAEEALAAGNHYEVLKIASLQYAFNLGGLNVYYDLLKGDAYERLLRLSGIAIEAGMPEAVRAAACVAEIRLLSNYYKNHLAGRVFTTEGIKK
jgi:hypothetical protein